MVLGFKICVIIILLMFGWWECLGCLVHVHKCVLQFATGARRLRAGRVCVAGNIFRCALCFVSTFNSNHLGTCQRSEESCVD